MVFKLLGYFILYVVVEDELIVLYFDCIRFFSCGGKEIVMSFEYLDVELFDIYVDNVVIVCCMVVWVVF